MIPQQTDRSQFFEDTVEFALPSWRTLSSTNLLFSKIQMESKLRKADDVVIVARGTRIVSLIVNTVICGSAIQYCSGKNLNMPARSSIYRNTCRQNYLYLELAHKKQNYTSKGLPFSVQKSFRKIMGTESEYSCYHANEILCCGDLVAESQKIYNQTKVGQCIKNAYCNVIHCNTQCNPLSFHIIGHDIIS